MENRPGHASEHMALGSCHTTAAGSSSEPQAGRINAVSGSLAQLQTGGAGDGALVVRTGGKRRTRAALWLSDSPKIEDVGGRDRQSAYLSHHTALVK